jgi:hypothetical protein
MGSKATYFTKLRGLATVVWNPELDSPLVEFNRQGLCCVHSADVAKKLTDMGYREVSAEEIHEAGLTLPNAPNGPKGPSKGYTTEPAEPVAKPSEVSGEAPMEAYLKGNKSQGEGNKSKGRVIVQ